MIDVMRKECFLDMVYREGTTSEKDEYSRYFELHFSQSVCTY